MDISDLYDHEIAKIGPVWQKLMMEFSRKANTEANLAELSKRAHDEFLKIGLVIDMNTMPCIIADEKGRTQPPEIVVLGRVDKTEREGGFDFERKRFEVLKSKERGEDFMGQKEKAEQ